jgi:hypothetical protein
MTFAQEFGIEGRHLFSEILAEITHSLKDGDALMAFSQVSNYSSSLLRPSVNC